MNPLSARFYRSDLMCERRQISTDIQLSVISVLVEGHNAGRSHLRSAVTGTVFVPGSRTSTIGPRAFAISSPSAWNSLPVDLRDPGLSLLTFRRRLKTYLFNPPG